MHHTHYTTACPACALLRWPPQEAPSDMDEEREYDLRLETIEACEKLAQLMKDGSIDLEDVRHRLIELAKTLPVGTPPPAQPT